MFGLLPTSDGFSVRSARPLSCLNNFPKLVICSPRDTLQAETVCGIEILQT